MSAPITCTCMASDCSTCYAREWARRRYRLRAYGQWSPWGDIDAVRAHLEFLRTHRIGVKTVASAAGVGSSTVCDLRSGRRTKVTKDVAERILAVGPDATLRINPLGTARRMQALNALGYSSHDLARRLSTPQATAWQLLRGGTWVSPEMAQRVDSLYRALCMTPGPSQESRRRAIINGYAPPLAWTDIDNPDEVPHTAREATHRTADEVDEAVVIRIMSGERMHSTKAEKVEITRRWLESGRSLADLERRTGWKAERYHEREGAA